MPDSASADGFPSLHVLRATLHVAAIVDRCGSRAVDAEESYWHHATGGTFSPPDLQLGEDFLCAVGLLVDVNGTLMPTASLRDLLAETVDNALAALCVHALDTSQVTLKDPRQLSNHLREGICKLVPDAARREELLLAVNHKFSDAHRRVVGEIGEELVVTAAREELLAHSRPDLARTVRRVSLMSDQLGYDVTALRIAGPQRLLEVKATTIDNPTAENILVHLSRNEADTGATLSGWALVVCVVEDIEERRGRVLGWCPVSAVACLLPRDGRTARWEQAAVELPVASLVTGLPALVA
jgi:hypothetical protein